MDKAKYPRIIVGDGPPTRSLVDILLKPPKLELSTDVKAADTDEQSSEPKTEPAKKHHSR